MWLQHFADVLLGAPEDRRLDDVGGWGHVAAGGLEEGAGKSLRRPSGRGDDAPGAADAGQLRGRDRVARGEHVAEGREHAVEALVFERQRLGVGLHPFDLDTRFLCPSACVIEVLGSEIAPDDSCASQRRRNRDRAATTCADVEHVHAGFDANAVEQPRAHVRYQVRGLSSISSGPCRAVSLLDLGQIHHSAPPRSGDGDSTPGALFVSPDLRGRARRRSQPHQRPALHTREVAGSKPAAPMPGGYCARAMSQENVEVLRRGYEAGIAVTAAGPLRPWSRSSSCSSLKAA